MLDVSLQLRHGSAVLLSRSPSYRIRHITQTTLLTLWTTSTARNNCMRLLLTCLRPHPASTILARSSLVRHIPNHLAVTMATSPKKQVKLDAFINHNDKGDGSSKGKAIDITGSTTSAFASSSVSPTSNGKGKSKSTAATKRPRDDGTDVPAAAKRSKANGTYRAFPNGTPDPPEDTVEGLTSILAKLEEVQKKAKPVKVCVCASLLHIRCQCPPCAPSQARSLRQRSSFNGRGPVFHDNTAAPLLLPDRIAH